MPGVRAAVIPVIPAGPADPAGPAVRGLPSVHATAAPAPAPHPITAEDHRDHRDHRDSSPPASKRHRPSSPVRARRVRRVPCHPIGCATLGSPTRLTRWLCAPPPMPVAYSLWRACSGAHRMLPTVGRPRHPRRPGSRTKRADVATGNPPGRSGKPAKTGDMPRFRLSVRTGITTHRHPPASTSPANRHGKRSQGAQGEQERPV